ncbi:flagellar biosynthetic protein FliO [Sansalvadorimonas sp. 2012CJ34-2]|uniref:Flagellar protein n=1 Tax=Parendozoicomonas callyspongiae TaxID=2942213 RepID=A0ABT0PET3_9GAMM|nr:flagellar biosynthetic protein FliO [Sansalvadorimonas sp. 2012CJ34-2]MCL6269287.1 flagellar biosynthetic protein FliO [Sansalvadorimonas sp. 2012CJ34-2]
MNRQITLLLLKTFLLAGSSLVFGGEPVSINTIIPSTDSETQNQGPDFWELMQSIAIFVLVICLLFFCSWMLKRWQPGLAPGTAGMKVISALPLGGRDRVVVVQAGERQLLLGVSPGKIVLLGDYEQLLPQNEPDSRSIKKFKDLLKP